MKIRRPSVVLAALILTGLVASCSDADPSTPAATSSPSAAASASAAPSPSPSPVVSTAPATPIYSVVKPKTLLGRAESKDAKAKEVAAPITKLFAQQGSDAITGIYGSIANRNLVIVGATSASNPSAEEFVSVLAPVVFKDNKFTSVAPGPNGGAAKCANVKSGNTTVAMCIWATTTTFGVVYFTFGDAAKAESLLAKVRQAVEKPV